MFLGTHSPRLDDKGRLFLPAKFRERAGGGPGDHEGQERCLYVFPRRVRPLTERLRRRPGDQQGGARLQAGLPRRAPRDEVPDKQGRITIPPALRTTRV